MTFWERTLVIGALIWLAAFVGPWPMLLLIVFAAIVADQVERIQKS